jgi:hypothetical protein
MGLTNEPRAHEHCNINVFRPYRRAEQSMSTVPQRPAQDPWMTFEKALEKCHRFLKTSAKLRQYLFKTYRQFFN